MSPYLTLPLRTYAEAAWARHWARVAALPANDNKAKIESKLS